MTNSLIFFVGEEIGWCSGERLLATDLFELASRRLFPTIVCRAFLVGSGAFVALSEMVKEFFSF